MLMLLNYYIFFKHLHLYSNYNHDRINIGAKEAFLQGTIIVVLIVVDVEFCKKVL